MVHVFFLAVEAYMPFLAIITPERTTNLAGVKASMSLRRTHAYILQAHFSTNGTL